MTLKRVVMHWTAGSHKPSGLDLDHYHFVIDGNGQCRAGKHKPEGNISTKDGAYAAHTRNLNTGSIGVAVAAMLNATERPFYTGPFPITERQLAAFVRLVAGLCEKYDIPVTPQTVLTHAEVQPTLGVAQRGKWDITWLPGMSGAGDPVAVGNVLRALVQAAIKKP